MRPDGPGTSGDDGPHRRLSISRVREHSRIASSDVGLGAAGLLRRVDAGRE